MAKPAKISPELAADLLVVREAMGVPLRRLAADVGVSPSRLWERLARVRNVRRGA